MSIIYKANLFMTRQMFTTLLPGLNHMSKTEIHSQTDKRKAEKPLFRSRPSF